MTTVIGTLNYLTTGELHEKISTTVSKQKANKLLSKPKTKGKTAKPYPLKISDPADFVLEHEEEPEFLNNLNPNGTYIAYSVTPYPEYLQEDKASFAEVFVNISTQTINHQYWRKFLVIRGSTMLSIAAPVTSKDRYINFIKDLVKLIYKEIYEKRANTDNIDLSKIESLTDAEQEDKGLLSFDFFNPSTLSIVTSLYEIFDKITDDEIENCVFLASHSFIHPYNWFLSPAALALAYFHSQLLFLKKPYKDDLYYTKQNLPSVTYISLTGIYSEMDIDILNAFSDNIQTIVLYDENTGGPNFSQKGEYKANEDLRIKKKNFQEISNKLLLVPFHSSKTKKQGLKDFSPNDLLWIFENVILAAIEKFKPTYIVLNCSLIFDESNNTPFLMDSEAIFHITTLLKQVCDNKVIVFPFKLANQKNRKNAELFNRVINYAPKNQQDRLRSVVQKYGVPYNNLHVRDIFMSIFEALAGLKETPNNWERLDLIKRYKTNTIMGEVRYRVGKQYKDHPYYKNLYSNILGVLSRIAKNEHANIEGFSLQSEKKLINKIALYYPPDNDIKILKLKLQTEGKEIILNQNSQYFVDYINPEEVKVYIFNANSCEINSNLSLRTYGPRSNFELTMELEDTVRQYSIDDHESINVEDLSIEHLKDCGLCKCGDFVFQIYGTDIKTNQDSTKIYYFNFRDTTQHYQINVPTGVLPRHGVTACAFKKDDVYYVYVFGGKARTGTKWNDAQWGTLDIIDIVEIYYTKDPLTQNWTYVLIPKDKEKFATEKDRVPFIPYYGSFAYYSERKNKILLMGGKLFEKGVSEWTFPILEFDIEAKRFDSLKVILNDAKNNPARPQIKNNEYKRPVLPTAIADKSKNLFFDASTETFKFVIPRPDDLFVTLYSYDTLAQNSDYLDIEIDNEENITRIAPPSLNKDINPRSTAEKKVVNLETRLSSNFKYMLGYTNIQLAELFLLEWRVCQKDEISFEKLQTKLTELKERNKDYVANMTLKTKEMDLDREDMEKYQWRIAEAKNREKGYAKLLSFAETNKGFQDIITDNDSRTDLLRDNLVDCFSSSLKVEKAFTTYNKNFETFLVHELEDVTDKGKKNIFQVYEEAHEKKIFEKLDIGTKRKVVDLLNTLIKAFQEPKPVNPEYSFQSTMDATPKTIQTSFYSNPKQGFEENFVVDNSISFLQITEYFESRPLVYKLSPSVFLKDYVERTQKQSEAYEALKKSLAAFQKEVISSGSSISTAASESDIPDKSDQELKETLAIVFTAADRIVAKLSKHTRKSLKYGSFVPPPSLIRFELFLILLKRIRKDIEDPDMKVGKILHDSIIEATPPTTKDKYEYKKEPEISKTPVVRYEEAKRETFTEERATPNTSQVKKQTPPPVQTLPKPVGIDQEIQVIERELSPLLEDDSLDTTDKEGKDVKIYQDNLTTPNTYKLLFNPGRSELLVILQKDGQNSIRRLRFKIYLKGQNGKKGRLEDISFESSPYSIGIYENNLVAYIDQNLKVRHSDVYNKYKACVIYADLTAGIESVCKDSEVEDLVFRKLFLVGQDDHIHSRCLLVTEESLFLFGGRSFKFKGKASVRQHSEVALYFTKRMESVEQNSSEFKDSEIDTMNEKGEVAAIYTGDVIFVTKRFEPSVIEVFNKDGTTDEDENIEIPAAESLSGCTVRMNMVNFRGKQEILLSFFCKEKDIKFMLLDLETKEFAKEPINIVAEGQEKLNLLYTGFEEIEAPINKSGAKEIFFYTYRGDSQEVFKCEIKVGK